MARPGNDGSPEEYAGCARLSTRGRRLFVPIVPFSKECGLSESHQLIDTPVRYAAKRFDVPA